MPRYSKIGFSFVSCWSCFHFDSVELSEEAEAAVEDVEVEDVESEVEGGSEGKDMAGGFEVEVVDEVVESSA